MKRLIKTSLVDLAFFILLFVALLISVKVFTLMAPDNAVARQIAPTALQGDMESVVQFSSIVRDLEMAYIGLIATFIILALALFTISRYLAYGYLLDRKMKGKELLKFIPHSAITFIVIGGLAFLIQYSLLLSVNDTLMTDKLMQVAVIIIVPIVVFTSMMLATVSHVLFFTEKTYRKRWNALKKVSFKKLFIREAQVLGLLVALNLVALIVMHFKALFMILMTVMVLGLLSYSRLIYAETITKVKHA